MQNTTSDFLEILRALSEHKVDFIVVGGVCTVLHGAPRFFLYNSIAVQNNRKTAIWTN